MQPKSVNNVHTTGNSGGEEPARRVRWVWNSMMNETGWRTTDRRGEGHSESRRGEPYRRVQKAAVEKPLQAHLPLGRTSEATRLLTKQCRRRGKAS